LRLPIGLFIWGRHCNHKPPTRTTPVNLPPFNHVFRSILVVVQTILLSYILSIHLVLGWPQFLFPSPIPRTPVPPYLQYFQNISIFCHSILSFKCSHKRSLCLNSCCNRLLFITAKVFKLHLFCFF